MLARTASLFRSSSMVTVELYSHQLTALDKLRTGSILCGGVGSGKSRTALAYFYRDVCGCEMTSEDLGNEHRCSFADSMVTPKNLYIITTPRKRDTLEWNEELAAFSLSSNNKDNPYLLEVRIDSWNNIKKYKDVANEFFIFDEQRAVGYGEWAKAFISIARKNSWIMLSATPGDTWMDYCSVFIANGFYKNKSEFLRRHVVFNRFVKYPQVQKYLDTDHLERLRSKILVNMPFERKVIKHTQYVYVDYNSDIYERVKKQRWNIFQSAPAKDAGEMCRVFRRIVNTDPRRIDAVVELLKQHDRIIIFYNYDYERELIRKMAKEQKIRLGEWSGHKHDPIPKTRKWIFMVQYTAGAEGWNCIDTNVVVFYSSSYSYKAMNQAAGRIDRLNTPYRDLYYYHILTHSSIDESILKTLHHKKDFNVSAFMRQEQLSF